MNGSASLCNLHAYPHMNKKGMDQGPESKSKKLKEIAISCLKLGTIGFGGIAGMVSTIENEMVVRRKWIDHQHFMDVLSTSYIIPGPNAVEIVMHCDQSAKISSN